MTETDTNANVKPELEADEPLYCANHPNVETSLRCMKCGKPICPRCAVLTPTGYKCRECVRGQQKMFETAQWIDYPIAMLVAGLLALMGSLLVNVLGFFIIFIAPIAGGVIAEAVRRVTRRHRSKRLFQAASVATAIGALFLSLPPILAALLTMSSGRLGGLSFLFALLWPLLYAVIVTSTVYYRLSGIRMGI